jgi:Tfp pilus assembly protein PilF
MVVLWRMQDLGVDDPTLNRDLAYAYMARNWREAARDALSPALAALHDDAGTRYILGVLAMWDGDAETARQELERALHLDPSLSHAAQALDLLR